MKMAERLDAALRGAQVTPPELSGMVNAARQLELLKPVSAMPAADLGAARQAFMAEAARMRVGAKEANPHPTAPGWLERLKHAFGLDQQHAFSPVPILVTLALVVGMVLGLGWLNRTSQAALPGDGLYSVKLLREDINLTFSFDPAKRVDLNLRHIQTRSQEIYALIQQGRPIPNQSVYRLQRSLENALVQASRLTDAVMQAKLAQIRQASTDTLTLVNSSLAAHGPQPPENLAQAASAASQAQGLANLGMTDPEAFRFQMAAPKPITFTPEPTLVVMMPSATAVTLNLPPGQATLVPTTEPTLVVMMPSATAVTINLPPGQMPSPTPTATNPPPVLPTPTAVIIAPTLVPATPTCTCTATVTPEATQPAFPTPTPVMQGIGE